MLGVNIKLGSAILYPFLLAVFPGLYLLSVNQGEVPLVDGARSILLLLLAVCILILFARGVLGSWHAAAFLVSVVILLFFSYGQLYSVIKNVEFGGVVVGRHRYLLALWLFLMAITGWLAIRRRDELSNATPIMNFFAGVLLVPVIYGIVATQITILRTTESDQAMPVKQAAVAGTLPDVYYIVLDAYAREDILRSTYGFDNSQFLEFLEGEGFYIAAESTANYLWTALSLTSTLNMKYIQDLPVNLNSLPYPQNVDEILHHNEFRRTLESLGYITVSVPSDYGPTDWRDADFYLTPDTSQFDAIQSAGVINSFESLLISTTALQVLLDLDRWDNSQWIKDQLEYPFSIHRMRILSAFEQLKSIPAIEGPKFVFIHVLAPRKPYVFGPDGEDITNRGPFTYSELDDLPLGEDSLRYLDQLTFVNGKLETTILSILKNSSDPPIIIIQSDHGPGLGIDWDDPSQGHLEDRSSVLNAYHLPQECEEPLYQSISPVNSFRVVLMCILENPVELLDDFAYFNNPWVEDQYEFETLPPD